MADIVNRSNGIRRIAVSILISICLLFSVVSNGHADGEVGKAAAGYGDSSMSSTGGTALPDLFTGTMSYQVPIAVPPGRKGMNPGIALTYRSYNGNGIIGVGWELELGSIQRSLKGGIDYALTSKNYQFRKTGASLDLVNISGSDYKAKIEGDFTKITQMPATPDSDNQPYWIATDRMGTRYTFGYKAASRQDDPNNSANIFKWCLSRVEDTNGNFMTITYFKDQGQIYPDKIEYTGNGTTILPTNYVKFYREARNDAPEMFTTNFRVKTAYRLKTIEAVANSVLMNKYELEYDAEPNVTGSQYSPYTGRSLLSGIRQYGSDGTSQFPPIILSYPFESAGWQTPTWTGTAPWTPIWEQCTTGDFNGDGKMDMACYTGNNGNWQMGLSTGSDWDSPFWGGGPAPRTPIGEQCTTGDFNGDGKTDLTCYTGNNGEWHMGLSTKDGWNSPRWGGGPAPGSPIGGQCVAGDFNGDGKTDLACYTGNNGEWHMALSTGSSWNSPRWGGGPAPGSLIGRQCTTGDFNGDGKADLACYTGSNGEWHMALSTGSGWNSPRWGGGPSPWTPIGDQCRAGDFNGDGKTDLTCYTGSNGEWDMGLSTGSGWNSPRWGGGPSPWTPIGDQCRVGDFNGDGKTDLTCYTVSNGEWDMGLSTGSGWNSPRWGGGPSPWTPIGEQCMSGDFNGDGKTDLTCYTGNSGNWHVALSAVPSSDLLAGLTNGLGGASTFEYKPSTQYTNTRLPFPLQTVSKITSNDGNGNISATDITYVGGYYHIGEKDFRGFNHATVKEPAGPNSEQRITDTWFHQGDETGIIPENSTTEYLETLAGVTAGYMKGKPYRTRISDSQGKIYSETTTTYAANSSSPYYFTPPLQVDSHLCDGDSVCRDTKTVYTYDAYGNVYREDQYGDPTNSANIYLNMTIKRQFLPNDTKWIVSLPSTVTVFQGIGDTNTGTNLKVSQKTYYYDDLTSCAATPTNNPTPDKGNLTRIRSWLGAVGTNPETNLEVRSAYDTYGNPTCSRDAKGYTSTIAYDASNTFPKTATNPLNQQTTTQYYGVDGVAADYGLYGQVKSVTDPNDSTITRTYDKLGRITKITDPYSSAPGSLDTYGTVSYQYLNFGTAGQQRVLTLTTEKADNLTAPNCPYPGSYNSGSNMCQSSYYYCSWGGCYCYGSYSYIGGGICIAYPYCPTGGYFDPNQDSCRSPNQVWSENYFDGLGRTYKTRKEGPDSKVIVTETAYDNRGAVLKASLPYFEGTETPRYQFFDYDPIGRTKKITKKDTANNVVSVTQACYKKEITALIDENSHRKRETRDALGRLTKVEEYTGTSPTCTTDVGVPYATTTYTYDVMNNLRYVTDANANQTEMRYDTLGRKYYMKDPDMGIWGYTYDNNGNLQTQTDAKNQTITFTYDSLNRILKKDYPAGSDTTYTYDETASTNPKGRLTSMSDESGTTRYHYDKLGRTVKTEKTVGSTTYNLEFTYDIMGRATSLKYPDGEIVGYGYDPSGNLGQVIGYATYSGFNALGQPGSLAYGNGVNTAYGYYSTTHSRLQTITTRKDTLTLQNLSYGYDYRGNITGISNLLDTTKSQILTYDEFNRLKTAQSTSYGNLSYSYDKTGNITQKEGVTYTLYPGKAHAIGSTTSGRTYTYDNNGNPTSDGTRTFTYTYDNMPRSINGSAIGFLYDGMGNRAKKTTPTYSLIYIDKLYERTTTGSTTSDAKYIFAGNQRIAVKTATETLYYHPDHLGSTGVATDGTTGASREVITYYPYGKTKTDTGTANLDHKYTSQELDGEVGLYNYGARLYDPEIGKFITPDTIVQSPGDPQTLNRYAYARNNPLLYTDPSGHLFGIDDAIIAAFVADVIIGAAEGAAIGSAVSAATGGDIGMGAMTGAVTGGFFGAAGSGIENLGIENAFAQAGIHAAAGASSGAINSTITGGDPAMGAAVGGAAAGISKYAGSSLPDNMPAQLAGRSAIGGVIGGTVSEIYGGNFGEGFKNGAITSALGFLANEEMHRLGVRQTLSKAVGGFFKDGPTAVAKGWDGAKTAWQEMPGSPKAALTVATGVPFVAATGPAAFSYALMNPQGVVEFAEALAPGPPGPNNWGRIFGGIDFLQWISGK